MCLYTPPDIRYVIHIAFKNVTEKSNVDKPVFSGIQGTEDSDSFADTENEGGGHVGTLRRCELT